MRTMFGNGLIVVMTKCTEMNTNMHIYMHGMFKWLVKGVCKENILIHNVISNI
jgi:hypothetical protein